MATSEELLAQCQLLPLPQRMELLYALAASIDAEDASGLSPEWVSEIERRCQDLDRNPAGAVPWVEVQRDLVDHLKRFPSA